MIERALFAIGFKGGSIVLATDGATIAWECGEISDSVEDLDYCALPREPGLYLFEGTPSMGSCHIGDGQYEPEVRWEGAVRRVKPEELESLLAMTPEPPE